MIPAAVIGCGRMGAFTSQSVLQYSPTYWLPLSHVEAIRLHPDLDLRGLCDSSPSAVSAACDAYGIALGTTDFADLLARASPQLVGIATRTIGRCDIIETAVGAGVRALHVEKPLCNSVAELDRLKGLFGAEDLYVTLGAVRRFISVFNIAKEIACSGRYGPIVEIRVCFGPAALFWAHPHSVDMILHIAGGRRVKAVQAVLSDVDSGEHPLQIMSDPIIQQAMILFEDGVAGHVSRAVGQNLEIACERGTITVVADGPGIEIQCFEGDNPYPVKHMFDGKVDLAPPQGSFGPISQLVACLRGDREAIEANAVVKRDIVLGQRILFAMVQSHFNNSALTALEAVDPAMDIRAITGGRPA